MARVEEHQPTAGSERTGLVLILPKEDHADDLQISVAAYGQLTVPISVEGRDLFPGSDIPHNRLVVA